MRLPPPWRSRKRQGKCIAGPTFKEQAELDGSGEELRTPETLTDLQLQNPPTHRPQGKRGGVNYPSNKEKETHTAKTLRGVRAFQLSLPVPEASQEGAASINTQTPPSCLLPISHLGSYHWLGFPGGSGNPPASARDARDAGLIPGSGRYPGIGTGNPLQYSCLKNSMDRGVWQLQFMESQRVRHNWATECACAHTRTHRS